MKSEFIWAVETKLNTATGWRDRWERGSREMGVQPAVAERRERLR